MVVPCDKPKLQHHHLPRSLSDFQIQLDYEVRVARYTNVSTADAIRVKVYGDDALVSDTPFPISDYLSEDRCNQLWRNNEDRPEASVIRAKTFSRVALHDRK